MEKRKWVFLKVTGLLKPVYRQFGFFPYLGSVTVQNQRQTEPWKDTDQVKQAIASLYERRHTPLSTALLIATTLILTLLLDISTLESPTWSTTGTIWQAHATIIGLSFVVLVFLLEIVSRSRLIEGALEQFLRKSWVLPALIYSLLGNLAIAALTLYPNLRQDWISANLPAVIVVITILGLLYVYRKVVVLVLTDETEDEVYTILEDAISTKIQEDITISEYDKTLDAELPVGVATEKALYPRHSSQKDSVTADDLNLTGVVADIHIPTFVYGVNEIKRVGEMHREEEQDDNNADNTEDQDEDVPVEVKLKIGDNLQEFSSILYIDPDFFHDDMEAIYPVLAGSILTRKGTGREQSIRTIYKYTDFLDQEGKRIVRNAQTRQFLLFLDQYEGVVRHSFRELEEAHFLVEEHRYTNGDLPFYDLDQIIFHVFEEATEEMNREFANRIIGLIDALLRTAAEKELYSVYRRYINLYSRFYFAIVLRDDLVTENFVIELHDTLIEHLGFSKRHGIETDLKQFEELDTLDFRINSYSEAAFEQAHKIFKYAFENQNPRGFGTLWRALNVPRNCGNDNVRRTLKQEQQDLRFNVAAMTYDISKEHEKYRETFKTIYNQCILKTYHNIPELFEIYFRIKEKEGQRTRWSKWGRQEHDIIKQMHGAPYSIDPDYGLGEFYCFTAIMNCYYDDNREGNPLQGNTISQEDFQTLRTTVNELKRKKPFIELRSHIGKGEFRNRADKFLEYHEAIVEGS